MVVVLIFTSFAIAQQDEFLGGYSQVVRRFYDPFNRQVFFGQDYTKPYTSYGLKGASSGKGAAGAYGSKGTGIVGSPLAYTSVTRYGRNPGHISRVSASVRGHKTVDRIVYLESQTVSYIIKNDIPYVPKGFARIISNIQETQSYPTGSVVLEISDLPPLDVEEVYEAWLVDPDSGYHMSIGLLNPGIGKLSRLTYDISYNLEAFKEIRVTQEFFPDLDPSPNGEVILIGIIE